MLLLVGLMVLCTSLVRITSSSARKVSASVDDRRARELAEAGVHEAMAAIAAGATGQVATIDQPAYLGGGVLWVESTDLGGGQYRLVATGMAGSGRAALDVAVQHNGGDGPLFNAMLNSQDQLTMNADTMVDSYDSSLGDYASQAVNFTAGHVHAEMNGHVASNDDIVLNARAAVFGDATPGPGHTVSFATDSFVSGSTAPAASEFTFPPIDVPPIPSSGDLVLPNGSSDVIPPGDHGFGALTIGKDATLQIQGPANIVVQDFTGGKDGILEIDATGGPITIYVQSSYTHINGFHAVGVPASPVAVAFFIEGTDPIVFPSNTAILGAYYAPEADITFSANNEAWGAFAAKRISMSSGMHFHFDENLMEYWETDTGGEDAVQILAWFEAEISPSFLRSNRRDPILLLGLDKATLPKPADAWDPGP
ncbi:MAG: hypothetical protein O7B99_07995 [Planctomycetota bacterium]|nr:hypothetical protein [Planctomycetota bacterium]